MANIEQKLKKLSCGNPLINFGMYDLYEEYVKIETDEELADFFHDMLNILADNRHFLRSAVFAMIGFSIGIDSVNLHLDKQLENLGIS